jgi:peroxiredoxin
MGRANDAAGCGAHRSRRAWLVLAAVVVVAAAVAAGATLGGAGGQPGGGAIGDGDEAAAGGAFQRQLATFDGGTRRLADYRGQPLVVNFFASWCPPCVAEMRDAFKPLAQRLGDDVAFLGVATQDERNAALAVVEATGVTYDVARDPDGALFRELGATSMPATFFVSAEGEVVDAHMGALTRQQLAGRIEANLDPG